MKMNVPLHGAPIFKAHFRGELASGRKFVFCPVGNIISWHAQDYSHQWCAYCQGFFHEFKTELK